MRAVAAISLPPNSIAPASCKIEREKKKVVLFATTTDDDARQDVHRGVPVNVLVCPPTNWDFEKARNAEPSDDGVTICADVERIHQASIAKLKAARPATPPARKAADRRTNKPAEGKGGREVRGRVTTTGTAGRRRGPSGEGRGKRGKGTNKEKSRKKTGTVEEEKTGGEWCSDASEDDSAASEDDSSDADEEDEEDNEEEESDEEEEEEQPEDTRGGDFCVGDAVECRDYFGTDPWHAAVITKKEVDEYQKEENGPYITYWSFAVKQKANGSSWETSGIPFFDLRRPEQPQAVKAAKAGLGCTALSSGQGRKAPSSPGGITAKTAVGGAAASAMMLAATKTEAAREAAGKRGASYKTAFNTV
jgi:hypothetical protein